MNDAAPPPPFSPPALPTPSEPTDPSVAGEEDPGAFEDDPAMRDALRGESAAVRSGDAAAVGPK